MEAKTYGYVRVSTREQNEARQLAAMREFGVAEENIVIEKLSGKDFNRPHYLRLVKKLRPEDVLVIKSIDRLGRDLTGTLIADIVLQLLSYVAQTERENIRQRQAEGITAAKERGVRFGRPPKPLPLNFHQMHREWREKKIRLQDAASACGMPVSSFYTKAVELEKSV